MCIIDLLKIAVPICFAILTGLAAYFYKQWAHRLDDYRTLLVELMVDINLDRIILYHSDVPLSEAARQELRILKPFPYFELGIFDDVARIVLKDTNDSIICLKIGFLPEAEKKADVLEKLRSAVELVTRMLDFFNQDLAHHMLYYYFARWKLHRKTAFVYHEAYQKKNRDNSKNN